jgi:hypothetical protein
MTGTEPWERPCTTCDGRGRVISRAWLTWHAEYGQLERLTDMTARLTALAEHVRLAPREPEATCPECDGDGVVVTELGLALLDFLDRRFGVRQRTPRAERRALPPPPPLEQPGAEPRGRPGIVWTGPVDQSALVAQAIAGDPRRAIASAVPYPSHPDAPSALRGAQSHLPPARPPPDAGPQGARPEWRSDDTGH